jgi:hypothetical protein
MIKSFGLVQVRSPDWFEIDQPTMNAVIESIDHLAKAIISWEQMNTFPESNACREEKPYGAHLFATDFESLQFWFESAPGRWEPSGPAMGESKTLARRTS